MLEVHFFINLIYETLHEVSSRIRLDARGGVYIATGRVRYYGVKHNLTWARMKYGCFNSHSKIVKAILEYELK